MLDHDEFTDDDDFSIIGLSDPWYDDYQQSTEAPEPELPKPRKRWYPANRARQYDKKLIAISNYCRLHDGAVRDPLIFDDLLFWIEVGNPLTRRQKEFIDETIDRLDIEF